MTLTQYLNETCTLKSDITHVLFLIPTTLNQNSHRYSLFINYDVVKDFTCFHPRVCIRTCFKIRSLYCQKGKSSQFLQSYSCITAASARCQRNQLAMHFRSSVKLTALNVYFSAISFCYIENYTG